MKTINTGIQLIPTDFFGIGAVRGFDYNIEESVIYIDEEFSIEVTLYIGNQLYDGNDVELSLSADVDFTGDSAATSSNASALFSNISVSESGTHTFTISAPGFRPLQITISISDLAESKYLILETGRSTYNVNETFPITVTAYNSDDSVDTDFDGDITITGYPGNLYSYAGNDTVPATDGVVVFDDFFIDDETDVDVIATADGYSSSGKSLSAVDTMESLSLVSFPSSVYVTEALSEFEAWALNSEGQLYTSFTGDVVLSKVSGPGSLGGTLTQPAVGGVATFDDVTVDQAGAYVLRVTGNALTDDGNLTVNNYDIVLTATETVHDISTGFTITATVKKGSETVTGFTSNITISKSSGAGTLSGTLTRAADAGTVDFPSLELDAAGAHVLAGNATNCDEGTIGITINEPPPSLEFSTITATTAGETIPAFTVTAKEAGGATDTDFDKFVTISIQSGTGTLSGTLTQKAVAGVCTFDDISIDTAGAFVLQATLPTKVLTANYEPTATLSGDLTGFEQRAQSITPTYSGDLYSIEYRNQNTGSATGTVVAKLYNESGDEPSGAALATSDTTIDMSTVGAAEWTEYLFSSGSVTAGVKSCISQEASVTGGSNFRWLAESGYAEGVRSYYNGSWIALPASSDHLFRVYIKNEYTIEDGTGAVTINEVAAEIYTDPDYLGWAVDSNIGHRTNGNVPGTDFDIVRVTNLYGDTRTGSLRWALGQLESSRPKLIVFEVGGVIDFGAVRHLVIGKNNFTISGKTAPDPGISVVNGLPVFGSCSNFVVEHMRFMPGDTGGVVDWNKIDCISVANNGCSNVVIDHCSLYWGMDENLQFWDQIAYDMTDVTATYNIIGEPLDNNGTEEGHSKALIIGDRVSNAFVANNLFVSSNDRHPLFKGGARGIVMNNMIYNCKNGITYVEGALFGSSYAARQAYMTILGNYLQQGDDTVTARLMSAGADTSVDVYMGTGSQVNVARNQSDQDIGQLYWGPAGNLQGSPPITHADTSTCIQATAVRQMIIDNCGARPWSAGSNTYRYDDTDDRMITEMQDTSGSAGSIKAGVANIPGGLPSSTAGSPVQETFVQSDWSYDLPIQKLSQYS